MWKVIFDSPYGGPPSIYWVAAESAEEAESVARQQIRSAADAPASATVQKADDIDPAEEEWPRPRLVDGIRVHTFTDSRTAYDHTQHRNDIHDGDVLFIPSENVAGFLMQAWPVAVSPNHGELHTLTDPGNLVIDGVDYTASARIAGTLLSGSDDPARPVPPTTTTLARGLVPTPGVWTVTVAGSERHDGERPYDWVVAADNAGQANAAAMAAHLACMEEDPASDPSRPDQFGEPTYQILATVAGLPGRGASAYNDARPGAAESGEHDCLAVEDLRHRVAAWVHHTDTHGAANTRMAAALAAEAALIVRHLAAVFDRGLA